MALKSVGYNCRKWTVFTLCLVNIIVVIAVVILVIVVNSIVVEEEKTQDEQTTPENTDNIVSDADWKIFKTVLIVSVVVIVLVHIFGLIATWKEHFYLSVAYAVFTVILGVVYIVAKFHIAPIFILMFVLDVPLSILSFVYSYDIYKHRNASNQMNVISMATLERASPSTPSQNNTFPNNNQTLPNQIDSNQDYPVQLQAGHFIEQNSAIQPMGYLPPGCEPHCEPPPYSEEDYHNENYPNQKYTVSIEKGQFIGQTAHSHM